MNHSVTRRHLMYRGLQVGAGGAVGSWTRSGETARVVPSARRVVRIEWDPLRRNWPARPADAGSRILFLSWGDVTATRPPGFNLEGGDVWWRHPDSALTIAAVSVV